MPEFKSHRGRRSRPGRGGRMDGRDPGSQVRSMHDDPGFREEPVMQQSNNSSQVPEAKIRGYKAGRFSFNVRGGRCETCRGDGIIKIEMHFLPDVYVPCEACKGARYNRETLEVKYKGKSIADVLDMTVDEGVNFFAAIPKIYRKLLTLQEVGLGYIRLGQPATTLSGGEAQRVKLATELSRRSTGKTLYILDEPTTGLHAEDIRKLLEVLQRLVEGGDTVVVIEHNLDVIKTADYLIDLGPEGGNRGGTIVATGSPEAIVKANVGYTGKFLGPVLDRTMKLMKQYPEGGEGENPCLPQNQVDGATAVDAGIDAANGVNVSTDGDN